MRMSCSPGMTPSSRSVRSAFFWRPRLSVVMPSTSRRERESRTSRRGPEARISCPKTPSAVPVENPEPPGFEGLGGLAQNIAYPPRHLLCGDNRSDRLPGPLRAFYPSDLDATGAVVTRRLIANRVAGGHPARRPSLLRRTVQGGAAAAAHRGAPGRRLAWKTPPGTHP
jgi:hypothetical protein